jgi:hypothetical protein
MPALNCRPPRLLPNTPELASSLESKNVATAAVLASVITPRVMLKSMT